MSGMRPHRTDQFYESPADSNAARGAQLEALSRQIERETRRDTLRTLLVCVLCSAIGALGMGIAVASTDAVWAPVIFSGAMLFGYGGVAVALLRAYRRHLERTGDW